MLIKILYLFAQISIRFGNKNCAWKLLSYAKRRGTPGTGLDLLRARISLRRQGGNPGEAFQCVLEELRSFPDNPEAKRLRDRLLPLVFPKNRLGDEEFQRLYERVFCYTMMSQERLHSLYLLARRCVDDGIPGDFVECGVAGGGGSAILAHVAASDSAIKRRVFACDTFEGMPDPTERDVSNGVSADATGWGKGTCRSGDGSLREICEQLGVVDFVVPVKGRFEETLSGLAGQLSEIALLHADGDWYSSTEAIFGNLYAKVVQGAPVQIDDYGFWKGCAEAVHDFEAAQSERFALHPIDSTGRWMWKGNAPYSARQRALGLRCNLGCGRQIHRDWLNVDCGGPMPNLVVVNLQAENWPLVPESVDLFYASHVFEHFSRRDGEVFLANLFRYLKPGGGVRLVVPDLEGLATSYLKCLEVARRSSLADMKALDRHEWSVIELIDQMVREVPGGEMLRHWCERPVRARDLILERLGDEAAVAVNADPPLEAKLERFTKPKEVFDFRNGGELHKWMYDEIGLSRLLVQAGFEKVERASFDKTSFPDFEWEALDASGCDKSRARKPDSLFIEAHKPHLTSAPPLHQSQ